MKATTILKLIERALNPDLKMAHLQAYAKAQIEKDRERVCQSLPLGLADAKVKIYNMDIILD